MATSQVQADRMGPQQAGDGDANGWHYTSLGQCDFYTGSGAPNHAAKKGSIYIDVNAAKPYICTVASGTWAIIGSIES